MSDIAQGLVGLGAIALLTCIYLGWNTWKKGMVRVAERDERGSEGEQDLVELRTKTVPTYMSANSALAAITFAALIIVIAFIVIEGREFEGLKRWVLHLVLGASGVAAVCWLVCLEQLGQIIAPNIRKDRTKVFKLYRSSMNLWVIAEALMICGVVLILLLANPYLAIGVGAVAVALLVCYWRVFFGWDRKHNDG